MDTAFERAYTQNIGGQVSEKVLCMRMWNAAIDSCISALARKVNDDNHNERVSKPMVSYLHTRKLSGLEIGLEEGKS